MINSALTCEKLNKIKSHQLLHLLIQECAILQLFRVCSCQKQFKCDDFVMRIVRFYLESWQKGHDTSPSASLLLLSPRVRRRQRIPKMEELLMERDHERASFDSAQLDEKEKAKRKFYWKYRYPPTVKKLSTLCSDVLAKCVIDAKISNPFISFVVA
jgi:hypothetical protein